MHCTFTVQHIFEKMEYNNEITMDVSRYCFLNHNDIDNNGGVFMNVITLQFTEVADVKLKRGDNKR